MHGTHADTMDWSLLVPVEFQGAKNLEIPTVLPCQGFISDNNWHNTARIGDTPTHFAFPRSYVVRPKSRARDAYSDLMVTGADCTIGTHYHYQYSSLMQESKSS